MWVDDIGTSGGRTLMNNWGSNLHYSCSSPIPILGWRAVSGGEGERGLFDIYFIFQYHIFPPKLSPVIVICNNRSEGAAASALGESSRSQSSLKTKQMCSCSEQHSENSPLFKLCFSLVDTRTGYIPALFVFLHVVGETESQEWVLCALVLFPWSAQITTLRSLHAGLHHLKCSSLWLKPINTRSAGISHSLHFLYINKISLSVYLSTHLPTFMPWLYSALYLLYWLCITCSVTWATRAKVLTVFPALRKSDCYTMRQWYSMRQTLHVIS